MMGRKIVALVAVALIWGCSGGSDVPVPVDFDADAGGRVDVENDVDFDGSLGDVGDSSQPDARPDSGPDTDLDSGSDAEDTGDIDEDVDPGLPEFTWPVETAPIAITAHESWKERIEYWNDPFIFNEYDRVGWVKFTVLVGDPSRVIFQNSHTYSYHFDFAAERLDPYLGVSRAEFDAVALYEQGQELILGAVLFPPQPSTREIGIQLVGQDAYHPEMVRIVFELVKASIDADDPPEAYYFPTFEQLASTQRYASEYRDRSIPVSSVNRWLEGDVCYSAGWALGRVKFVAGTDVNDAYLAGDLLSTDILVTDGVPADLPHVAGIVSLAPSTPNSHVAILANSYQVPFVYLRSEAAQQAALALDGQKGVLRARSGFGGPLNCEVRFVDGGAVSADLEQALLELKSPGVISYPPKASAGHYTASTDGLMPSDIQYYGGKAANFGIIRRALPDNSPEPVPIAFSFDLWDEFMDQIMASGLTLRAEIQARLAPFDSYPPPAAALQSALDEIVSMIRNETHFTAAQEAAIISALDGFEPTRRIRFRSSTNVEDSDTFTGAGLYNSNSGCLADDTDDDEVGPSHCDAGQSSERGVFRAIRRVYGSFYNIRAFTERLRHGVDEAQVGMGMLVHYSDPDPTEMANGVITLERNGANSVRMMVVTQPGAASVTNPSDNAQAEIVEISRFSFGTYSTLIQGSELLPLGQTTLNWESEYIELADHVMAVVDEFMVAHPTKQQFHLDLEYKKLLPGRLIIRQVREIPRPSQTLVTPYLIPESIELCTFQGEAGDVFGNHRNKLRWTMAMAGSILDEASLATSLLTSIDGSLLNDDQLEVLQGNPSNWNGASYQFSDGATQDSFVLGEGTEARTYTVNIDMPREVSPSQTPLVFPSDLQISLSVRYASPQPTIDWFAGATETTEDYVLLAFCPPDRVTSAYGARSVALAFGDAIRGTTDFWWPPSPRGITAGYTAPLVYFEETTIDGVGPTPIVLRDYYSQTYRPEHHNFDENFYFDFLLEPGLSEETLSALEAVDIRALVSYSDVPYAIGFDGKMRGLGNLE